MKKLFFALVGLLLLLSSCGQSAWTQADYDKAAAKYEAFENMARSITPGHGRELFFSDSLNARDVLRPYPEPLPDSELTPAPKGYKPVYISAYTRHGSRQLHRRDYSANARAVLASAAEAGVLTPLGEDVYSKVIAIDEDLSGSVGELTELGIGQHKAIAERIYRRYPEIFSAKGTPVRLYSTNMQRTMMSMFSCNARLLELAPGIVSERYASSSLTRLKPNYDNPLKPSGAVLAENYINGYIDVQTITDRLFTGNVPTLKNSTAFVRDLYNTTSIVAGMELEDADFLWDLFTWDELFYLSGAESYVMYARCANAPVIGNTTMLALTALLGDFMDKADKALAEDIPGADLRFGHDSYLVPFVALLGINGYGRVETDPDKVLDFFQDYVVTPMAGNVQMVFYRNKDKDTLVKIMHNENEAWIPVKTDIFPYYHWDDVRAYFQSLMEKY